MHFEWQKTFAKVLSLSEYKYSKFAKCILDFNGVDPFTSTFSKTWPLDLGAIIYARSLKLKLYFKNLAMISVKYQQLRSHRLTPCPHFVRACHVCVFHNVCEHRDVRVNNWRVCFLFFYFFYFFHVYTLCFNICTLVIDLDEVTVAQKDLHLSILKLFTSGCSVSNWLPVHFLRIHLDNA